MINDLTALMAASISTTLDEGSDRFIPAKRKEIVRSVQALSQLVRRVSLAISVYIALCFVLLDY